jgi:hypothetical protein
MRTSKSWIFFGLKAGLIEGAIAGLAAGCVLAVLIRNTILGDPFDLGMFGTGMFSYGLFCGIGDGGMIGSILAYTGRRDSLACNEMMPPATQSTMI